HGPRRVSALLREEGGQDLLRLLPHAEYTDVAGAGHMVAGDKNDLFNDAIVSFLANLRPQALPAGTHRLWNASGSAEATSQRVNFAALRLVHDPCARRGGILSHLF